ncbi:MAG: ABC transporter ATP-binding protein [Polyangiaceae bacterium]|nr:ABC transporter ATP-binding protein [Polyangiaceae bacterium]
MIEISELYKYYGQRRAVGPISLAIADGEVIGLLGRNGAGKTTTLRILACDLLASSGTVKVAGYDAVESADSVRANIGYLPDTPPLYGEMRVREYLGYAARLRGVSGKDLELRLNDVLAQTGLVAVAGDPIASLSHGFKQRVGIAQAIVHRPKLVILDEPISGLDPAQIKEMRGLIRGLAGQHTVIVSSHILSEISETCDRIFIIRDGEIIASGSEQELTAEADTGDRLQLTIRPDGDLSDLAALRSLLEATDGVSDVVIEESTSGEWQVKLKTATDRRALICQRVVEAGGGLLAIVRIARELESVFLELTDARVGVLSEPGDSGEEASA